MVVASSGDVWGSLTGGCVEAAVLEAGLEAIASGLPRTESFGYSDGDALAAGLSCGGSLEVHIQPLQPGAFPPGPAPAALLRLLDGGPAHPIPPVPIHPGPIQSGAPLAAALYTLFPAAAPADLSRLASRVEPLLAAGHTGVVPVPGSEAGVKSDGKSDGKSRSEPGSEPGSAVELFSTVDLFLECRAESPRLYLLGANDYSAALSRMGAMLGYRTTVVDARPAFTNPHRFPDAEAVVVQWPHELLRAEALAGRLTASSVVCLLSHDNKFDIPALAAALESDAGYVGAMGSRLTLRQRLDALRQAGVSEASLARLRSPIGLDIGANSPEEVALSVFAEVTAARSAGSTGLPLSGLSGPIHASSHPLTHLTVC